MEGFIFGMQLAAVVAQVTTAIGVVAIALAMWIKLK
jgi:hypothetical protein